MIGAVGSVWLSACIGWLIVRSSGGGQARELLSPAQILSGCRLAPPRAHSLALSYVGRVHGSRL